MSKRKNDIERYLRGEMTPSEMHALEREALQDPFLSDALEGAGHSAPENFLFDLQEIRSSIHQRITPRKPRIISMWNWSIGIAASLLLLAVSSIYIISSINDQQENKSLALKQEMTAAVEKQEPQNTDSVQGREATGEQINSSETAQKSEIEKKVKEPSALPSGPPETRGYIAQIEPVVQSQATETEVQRIVEAELSEAPLEIERNPPVEHASRAKQTVTAETAGKEAPSKTNKVLQGKVTSTEDGSALPGVNVLVKGTSIGTVTDAEGNYQIPVSDLKQTLVFAFIGMKPEEIVPGNKTVVDVQLSPDFSQLSEIVVVGYGNAAKPEEAPTLEFAEPQGGRKAFQQYLEEKMNYPEQAIENNVEGRVTVQFTVSTNGQLEDFKILKGLGFGCDDEVIRLIKEGPAWSPSKRNAQPVPEKVKVRLKFDIPEKQ